MWEEFLDRVSLEGKEGKEPTQRYYEDNKEDVKLSLKDKFALWLLEL